MTRDGSVGHTPKADYGYSPRWNGFQPPLRCVRPGCIGAVSAVHAHAEQIVTLRHANGFTVRAKMSKSALLRGDDPVTLTTFQDLTEQLWTEGS